MDKIYFISQTASLTLIIIISLIFAILGLYHSKKNQGLNSYLILGIFLNYKDLKKQILNL